MMKRLVLSTLGAGAVVAGLSLIATASAFAFGGCVNSPENPTWILAGIGGVAAGVPWLRSAIRRRRHARGR